MYNALLLCSWHMCLRVVCEVESLRELEVKLNSGTLVWPLQSIIDNNINLKVGGEREKEREREERVESERGEGRK